MKNYHSTLNDVVVQAPINRKAKLNDIYNSDKINESLLLSIAAVPAYIHTSRAGGFLSLLTLSNTYCL